MSLTMALVAGHASGNSSAIDQARQALVPVSTNDMLQSLYQFGQLLGKAHLTPEQLAAMQEELVTPAGTTEMTAAVQNIGRAILVERSQAAFVDAVNTYAPPLLNSTSDQLRQLTLTLAAVVGAVCRRLDVTFNWS